MSQKILTAENSWEQLNAYIKEHSTDTVFLVCDASLPFLALNDYFASAEERLGRRIVYFNDFQPNPLYESVRAGVYHFNESHAQMILAVGGGSAMDVAKCIKLYANMDPGQNYLDQLIVPNDIPFLAIPTTAGTGSEATRYAVIYYKGEKQSISHVSCIPDTVLMDPGVLKTLPEYQKKSTMLDALCHATESFWSVNSTDDSKVDSIAAIRGILANMEGYLANTDEGNAGMLEASHRAGKAINVTQTTAGHAMCYKLTSLFRIAHGHAAALCDAALFPYMIAHTDRCIDARGEAYLKETFMQIAYAYDCRTPEEAAEKLRSIVYDRLQMPVPQNVTEEDIRILTTSVNPVRLKNHPIRLDEETIDRLYRQILSGEKK